MAGVLKTDPVFLGLTRPPMLFGVSHLYMILDIYICLSYFVFTNDIFAFLVGFFVWGIGYLIHFKEPRFIELWMTKAQKCMRCTNRLFHGANSYDTY